MEKFQLLERAAIREVIIRRRLNRWKSVCGVDCKAVTDAKMPKSTVDYGQSARKKFMVKFPHWGH